jgi:SAM-dependent methyltransferase
MINLDKKYRPSYFRNKNRGTGYHSAILASAICEVFRPMSVVDFGCGSGRVLAYLKDCGASVLGIEGTKNCYEALQIGREHVLIGDLRTVLPLPSKFDLAISFEVAEHLEPEFASTLVWNLSRAADRVLVSAAGPEQDGWGHVNCRPKQYWERKFAAVGFYGNQNLLSAFQAQLSIEGSYQNVRLAVIQSNVMVFERKGRPS